ncbi:SMI1/KNR4 family protein [Streptomyces sp. KM273126]|uniref:hypothetical protein n=1 Tax=Streptomyces sp. KM273126 TaxID=2545247 RepID=UPI001040BA09|nr:hypothetical protein [Streptomyces sp. KM273126]MBA2809908.1 SMI1/KNR4 family protein [Streptomyces sp. KM273126]
MTESADLDALRRLMPPPADGGTRVDWDAMTASWGRPFPPDYQRFMEVYGAGAVQDYLAINTPEPKVSLSEAQRDGMVIETANAEADWETEDKAPELEGTSPVLINWGVDATADMLCWDASDEDPAKWPVVVYARNGSLWSRYDCGMVEFLVRVLRADFPECPLGGLFMWGVSEATFEKRGG